MENGPNFCGLLRKSELMEAVIWSFQIKVETLENLCGKVASKFQDTGSSSSQMHTKFLACTILLQYHTISSKSSSRTLYKFRVSTFSWLNLMITKLRLKLVYRACVKIHSFLKHICAIFNLSKQGPFH